jgi:hypothetical protein
LIEVVIEELGVLVFRTERGLAMWHMEDGDRAMTEAEWSVFRLGLAEFVAHLEDDLIHESDAVETGVKVFDRLTVEQKLALLADVADAMRNPDVPMMDLTAASEGTVAAVFVVARALLREEIAEKKEDTTMRSLLLASAKEQDFDKADIPRLNILCLLFICQRTSSPRGSPFSSNQ